MKVTTNQLSIINPRQIKFNSKLTLLELTLLSNCKLVFFLYSVCSVKFFQILCPMNLILHVISIVCVLQDWQSFLIANPQMPHSFMSLIDNSTEEKNPCLFRTRHCQISNYYKRYIHVGYARPELCKNELQLKHFVVLERNIKFLFATGRVRTLSRVV